MTLAHTISENHLNLSLLPCMHLKGVGKRMGERLERLGILKVQDLLFHLPMRYQDRTRIYAIRELSPEVQGVVEGMIVETSMPKGGRTRLLCRLEDPSGYIHLRFFYVNPIQLRTFKIGARLRCFGEVRFGKTGLEMIHPEYLIVDENTQIIKEDRLTPIYPSTDGISQSMWRKLTEQVLVLLQQGAILQDILPKEFLQTLHYPSLIEALQYVHRPPINAPLLMLAEGKHLTQKRLVFEELLAHRLSMLNLKKTFQTQLATPLAKKNELMQLFLQNLTFTLTGAQERVADEIYEDLGRSRPMLRLVQGDVGSGKTVVAALAVIQAIANHCQAAILAPTELLVEQHYTNFQNWFAPLGINVVKLSGQMKVSERSDAMENIALGVAHVVVGTHAIFQEKVSFQKLALIIMDEQHRFGVEQRARLREKGVYADLCPHLLMMTATPIPRTLAMSHYADMDCSVIDELPKGRQPIKTSVISNTRRDEVLLRIRDACSNGRQAYWVCTLIEESEVLQCEAAEDTLQTLAATLPELKIALLHGRMKSIDKDNIMLAFKNGEIDLLVATTVIEVGVDVPNASLMVIENAERLGLAQLHQLRGRVGRGVQESYCLLLYQTPLAPLAKARLEVMRETTDGFVIAERDLAIRGPGEVLGTKQTGDVSFRLADLLRDSHLLPDIQKAADCIRQDYPDLVPLLIKRWLATGERFGNV